MIMAFRRGDSKYNARGRIQMHTDARREIAMIMAFREGGFKM